MRNYLIMLPIIIAVFVSCEKEGVKTASTVATPKVTTLNVSDIGMASATFSGQVVLPEELGIDFELGFEVSLSQTFEETLTTRYKASAYNKNMIFSVLADGTLMTNRTLYVRAYMINRMCFYDGEILTFKTRTPMVTSGAVSDTVRKTSVAITNIADIDDIKLSDIILGICWSDTKIEPTIEDSTVTTNQIGVDGKYEISLTGLKYGKTYNYRAYIKTGSDIYYGELKDFFRGAPDTNGKIFVDMGLPSGILWATCNVGADSPDGYGDYFAWGETETKTIFDWNGYKHCICISSDSGNAYYPIIKYCDKWRLGYQGFTDGKTLLESEDDAASVNWGGDWRMPTREEFGELCNPSYCLWIWYDSGNTEFKGVPGYKVVSKEPGYESNYIFFPATGYKSYSTLIDFGEFGDYWSSSLYSENIENFGPNCAFVLRFGANYYDELPGDYRALGRKVRPVCQ